MKPDSVPRSRWPAALFATFAIFISGIAMLVTLAVHSDQDLVRDDYYDQEIRYQKQIDRESRAAALGEPLDIRYDAASAHLEVRLPAAQAARHPTGTMVFYRPSDARLDTQMPLKLDSAGLQIVSTSLLQSGFWKLRVTWEVDGMEYYSESPIVIKKGRS